MATIQKTGAAPKKGRTVTVRAKKSGNGKSRKGQRPKSKVQKRRGGRRVQGLALEPQRSLVLDAVDEIGKVTEMLEAAPMFHHLALMVRQINEGMPPKERDEIARAAKKHFGVDIDKLVEQPVDLDVIDEIPEALAASARWRLERLERVLYRGLRGKEA